MGDIGTWLLHLDRGSPRKVCMEDKNNSIFRLYGVKKKVAEHFRAHLVIDTEQVVRARIVVGDLPVVLVMEEMVRQVKACKLVVTGVCVDGESKEMVEWIWKLKP